MKRSCLMLLAACFTAAAYAKPIQHGPMLYCHRTANEDMPENTLASLEHAALLGCNVVEIDLRRTLDGEIVLNHDGILERLTDGEGSIEQTSFAELQLLDAGTWMAARFSGVRIARFDEALRLARSLDIRLILDIKTKGIGPEVLRILEREGMLNRVQFNGEWDDIHHMLPSGTDAGSETKWVQPGVTATEVNALHHEGKAVIANFSANDHLMDLDAMKAAVAAGVDAINVDYPLLGADAVGRPVEAKLSTLAHQAETGPDADRAAAIRELARYDAFVLQPRFLSWLNTDMPQSSRAAALALLSNHPRITAEQLAASTRSDKAIARANTAWLLGMINAPAPAVLPLLHDSDPHVQAEALRALARATGEIPQEQILAFFSSSDPSLRGAAGLALAHLHPTTALPTLAAQFDKEIEAERPLAERYVAGNRKTITAEEIKTATESFRVQMSILHAISSLHSHDTTTALERIAFRPAHEFAQMDPIIACFQLWDRAGEEPDAIVQRLSSPSTEANCAEWSLIKADSRVLPAVRKSLVVPTARASAIRILAWHGDLESLPALQKIAHTAGPDSDLAAWAAEKIRLLNSLTDSDNE